MGVILSAQDTAQPYIDKALAAKLHETRYWQLLLHRGIDGVSEIDDPKFFISSRGKEDAKAELAATIRALYNEERFDDNATACRYPARKAWLQDALQLEGLPQVECKAYDDLMAQLDPRSVTLVFSSAFINSPGSMFGHTFLRIDSVLESKLLSYAVNYSAQAVQNNQNAVEFAIKGLVGSYPGKYSLLPYYEKLKEYSDTEQRDVWEYDLNLTHEEVQRMVRHIWELNDIYSWYYFFDENCSYNLLWLLEIARPGIELRDAFFYQVIPPETVHVIEAAGLVGTKHFRPSKRAKLLAYETRLSPEARRGAVALARGEEATWAKEFSWSEKRLMLEAASELTEYAYIENDMNKTTYTARFHDILSQRAALGKGERLVVAKPPNPDIGHRAIRATLQSGWREGSGIHFLGVRPAYHDLDDSDVGYLRGTQIEFLDLLASYDEKKADIESMTLLSIVSLAPRSDFFSPMSWRMKCGWDKQHLDPWGSFHFSVGAGMSWEKENAYWYLMADPFVYAERETHGGIGLSAGMVLYDDADGKARVEVTRRYYEDAQTQWIAGVSYARRLTQDLSASLRCDYLEKRTVTWRTQKVVLDLFF